MIIPNGATHKWMPYDFFTKRAGGQTWAVWQDEHWLWIGDELGGEMVPLVDDREKTRQEIIDLAAKMGMSGDFINNLASRIASEGYRKFEINDE